MLRLRTGKSAVVFSILLILVLPLAVYGKRQTDREEDGLFGPVESVTSEEAKLSQSFGAWVEDHRHRTESKTYSAEGNLLVWIEYGDDGQQSARRVSTHDTAGRWIETRIYNALNQLKSRTVNEYVAGANLRSSCTVYFATGALDKKAVFLYDASGNLIRWDSYDADGTLNMMVQTTYDGMGNAVEECNYNGDGTLFSRRMTLYSSTGRVVHSTFHTYNKAGTIDSTLLRDYDERGNEVLLSATWAHPFSLLIPDSKTAYEYLFDSHGNWIKQTGSEWVTKFGTSYWEPRTVIHRTITYY
jgi:hypothetical protein